jgi:hypothetical protein
MVHDEWLGEIPSEDLAVASQDGAAPAATNMDEDLEGKSADEIRAKIEHTRQEMTSTIDAIQDRLNPDKLKAKAAAKLHDATMGTMSRAAQAVVNKVAEMTPQPRHENPHFPYGQSKPEWQKTVERTRQWMKDNPKLLGYLAAGGVLMLGMLAKRRSNARTRYYINEFRD